VARVGTPLAIGLPVARERPRSRGRVSLSSSDPHTPPLTELDFAADPDDVRRLVAGRSPHHPPREHQPHLRDDRRARIRLDA
jgi:hypothetical protein